MFWREHRPGTPGHATYNANRGYDAKRAFRNQWCQFKIQAIKERKIERTTYGQRSENHGVYHPFGKIVQEEGGWSDPSA
eukprot:14256067-Alexandrium_andersonii.AAC.1